MSINFKIIITKKIIQLRDIIQNVVRQNKKYKNMGILDINGLTSCVNFVESILKKLNNEMKNLEEGGEIDESKIIITMQDIVGDISALINLYGCDTIDNLINICIGNNFKVEDKYISKYKLLNTYITPTNYKIIDWNKNLKKNDEIIAKTADNLDCFDLDNTYNIFQNRIYGIKVAIHNIEKQNTIVVYGIIEDTLIELLDNDVIHVKINSLKENKPEHPMFNINSYERFIKYLTLRDLLIYSTDTLKNVYTQFLDDFVIKINKKPLSQIINEFIEQEIFYKRNILINLLLNSDNNESYYLAYLLYDLLSNDIHGVIDTYEQTLIYDSLPWHVQTCFRDAMKQTINYTNKISKIDHSKISFEQQICLMKTDDTVKEKAMVKLKEVKLKSEDTGSKARQYLEGLLKIPFEIYKEEPVLRLMGDSITLFSATANLLSNNLPCEIIVPFTIKPTYTSIEVQKYFPLIKNNIKTQLHTHIFKRFKETVLNAPKKKLNTLYGELKDLLNANSCTDYQKINLTGKSLMEIRSQFNSLIEQLITNDKNEFIYEWIEKNINDSSSLSLSKLNKNIINIDNKLSNINTCMKNVHDTLDNSVYGHTKAKRQIERIIGQWLNGDITGYCFGFEGPPGVGKTSLAKKGISCCLKDDAGVARPFAFIAMGGSTNSSTLDGHNYTYVGSSWGRIVDILMDTKIMNPIIFIDELDKVSKTENGKEIIGILTHLIDQTQNDTFQDKYFNGINLNLSKALFIFSYNDVDAIDRILLDRIHRIKFDHLSNADKLIIVRSYILPEVYKKMGLIDMIEISDEVIEFIIDEYTAESGVRKLKEIIFEIVGEINLSTLKYDSTSSIDIPIIITIDDLKTKYLKERREIKPTKIHEISSIGVINGLWANSVGKGGVLPIETSFFPSTTFLDLKLTGMQGDVMKESMAVAKSLAWTLFSKDIDQMKELQKKLDDTKNQGLHIHVPEGSTPKDGPSAGTAITIAMYSLFTGKKIKNDVAITGEICLQGRVTAIGGLDLKILGGIKAGVKTFIFPKENEKDFNEFMEKYSNKIKIKNINFIMVETIDNVIPIVFT